jgi:hypothetical protein
LWIDRYYIAMDDLDANRIEYVYLTLAHWACFAEDAPGDLEEST